MPADEHERTAAFATSAMDRMRALSLSPSPRNFEIWYNYVTGSNPALNDAVNRTLEQKGALSDADLQEISRACIVPGRDAERIDAVGARVLDEIQQVLEVIGDAAGSATSYSASLADASKRLEGAHDGATLRIVIDRLLKSAKEMGINNRKLEARLTASRQEIALLQQNLEIARSESRTDPLTALANRKFFDQALGRIIAEARRKHGPLSLLLADVDHFKSFNDRYGHLTGDQVLRLVAIAMKQNIKGQDIAARYGGEEFAIALPNTALSSAVTVADHIRRAVMAKELKKRSSGEHLGRVTISIGVAMLQPEDTVQSLIDRADRCLYAAKGSGRNRVICESDAEAAAAATVTTATRVA